jgi:hypothetical protein
VVGRVLCADARRLADKERPGAFQGYEKELGQTHRIAQFLLHLIGQYNWILACIRFQGQAILQSCAPIDAPGHGDKIA